MLLASELLGSGPKPQPFRLTVERLGSGLKHTAMPLVCRAHRKRTEARSHAARRFGSPGAYRSVQPCRLTVELLGGVPKRAAVPLDNSAPRKRTEARGHAA
eukprot:16437480-Heterocapsa_arctica.AAC.1